MLPPRHDNVFLTAVERELRRRHNDVVGACAWCKKTVRISDDYALTAQGLIGHVDCSERSQAAPHAA